LNESCIARVKVDDIDSLRYEDIFVSQTINIVDPHLYMNASSCAPKSKSNTHELNQPAHKMTYDGTLALLNTHPFAHKLNINSSEFGHATRQRKQYTCCEVTGWLLKPPLTQGYEFCCGTGGLKTFSFVTCAVHSIFILSTYCKINHICDYKLYVNTIQTFQCTNWIHPN
jgi:hypothetical protein